MAGSDDPKEEESEALVWSGRDSSETITPRTNSSRCCSCLFDITFRTLILVNIAAIVETADEALSPAVYKEIGETFHATPSQLGTISLARALCQALSFPFAALLVLIVPRVSIVALGALIWGLATAGVGLGSSFIEVAFWRGINGIGLALVVPAIQSLVADSATESNRGIAFGWLQFVSNWGNIIGGVLGVMMAAHKPFGIDGWRFAFHLVAAVSVIVAALVHKFTADPPLRSEGGTHRLSPTPAQEKLPLKGDSLSPASSGKDSPSNDVELSVEPSLRQWAHPSLEPSLSMKSLLHRTAGEKWKSALKETLEDTVRVLRVPSFCIIVLQGLVGSFAWGAMSFVAMWLELIGFSHEGTAALLTTFSVMSCLGGLFGGWFGDFMARRYPNSGRIIVAQISSGTAVVCSFVVLRLIPADVDWWKWHFVSLVLTGFMISWNAPATNNPIFAEIVPEKSRTNVYALDGSFETGVSAFAPLTVGFLAESLFGYTTEELQNAAAKSSERSPANAEALSGGLFLAMAIPFGLCCLCYTFLYWTYPVDRNAVRFRKVDAGVVLEQKVPALH